MEKESGKVAVWRLLGQVPAIRAISWLWPRPGGDILNANCSLCLRGQEVVLEEDEDGMGRLKKKTPIWIQTRKKRRD